MNHCTFESIKKCLLKILYWRDVTQKDISVQILLYWKEFWYFESKKRRDGKTCEFHFFVGSVRRIVFVSTYQKVVEGLYFFLLFEGFSDSAFRSKWNTVRLRKFVKLTALILRVMLECVGEYIRSILSKKNLLSWSIFSCALYAWIGLLLEGIAYFEKPDKLKRSNLKPYSCKKFPLLLASCIWNFLQSQLLLPFLLPPPGSNFFHHDIFILEKKKITRNPCLNDRCFAYSFLVSPKLLIPFSLPSKGYITSIGPYITDGSMLLSNVALD